MRARFGRSPLSALCAFFVFFSSTYAHSEPILPDVDHPDTNVRLVADGTEGMALPEFSSFEDALAFADDAWVFGDYELVVRVLEPRLFPQPPPVGDEVLIRAWTRLGSSAFYEGNSTLAHDSFYELLRIDPEHTLDRLVFPAQVIAFFEDVRTEHAAEFVVQEGPAVGETVYVVRSVTRQPRLVSMLPFGVGFYTQDRDIEGTVYLLGEAALGVASAWLYIANESARDSDGFYADVDLAERRQRAQVGTGVAFFALVAINMLHGALTHRSELDVEYQSFDDEPPGMQPQSRSGWRFGFTPLVYAP
jgi:hypothetical protein